MTGLTPVPRVAFQSWTEPAIEPWSERLTDGISSSAARETRSGTRHAPSRIEYSEWTCRWTNSAVFEAVAIAEGHSTPGSRRVSERPQFAVGRLLRRGNWNVSLCFRRRPQ